MAQGFFGPFILTQCHPYLHVAHGAASNSDSAISPYLCRPVTLALFELLSSPSIIVVTGARLGKVARIPSNTCDCEDARMAREISTVNK